MPCFQDDKKFTLPPGTTLTGVSVIDGVPMVHELQDDDDHQQHHQQHHHHQHIHGDLQEHEATDSNDDDPISISLVTPAASAHPNSGASSPNSLNGSSSQQLTEQVSVVQSQGDMEPHYITVTGEFGFVLCL